jgi:hypothetical protein
VNSPTNLNVRRIVQIITRSFRRSMIPEAVHRTAKTKAIPEQRMHAKMVLMDGYTCQAL